MLRPGILRSSCNLVVKSTKQGSPSSVSAASASASASATSLRRLHKLSHPILTMSTCSSTIFKPWPHPMVESHGDYRDEAYLEDHIGGNLYSQQHSLPKLPVPNISDTIARFVPTALPLAKSHEEKAALLNACQEFESQASELQRRLIERKEVEMKDTSWLQLWWNTLGYLQVSYILYHIITLASFVICRIHLLVFINVTSTSSLSFVVLATNTLYRFRFAIRSWSMYPTSSTSQTMAVFLKFHKRNPSEYCARHLSFTQLPSSVNWSLPAICHTRQLGGRSQGRHYAPWPTNTCSTRVVFLARMPTHIGYMIHL